MKRTLKRELKVREIAKRETIDISSACAKSAIRLGGWCTFVWARQHQFRVLENGRGKVACLRVSVIDRGSYSAWD